MLPIWMGLLGCRTVDADFLADIEVQYAEIDRFQVQTVALIGGALFGQGELLIEAVDRQEYLIPVEVKGGTVGLGVDLLPVGAVGQAILELPDRRIYGDELFGRYKGSSQSFVAGAGVEVHHLRNEYGVIIDEPAFGVGIGVMAGGEWLTLRPKIGELRPLDTEGAP